MSWEWNFKKIYIPLLKERPTFCICHSPKYESENIPDTYTIIRNHSLTGGMNIKFKVSQGQVQLLTSICVCHWDYQSQEGMYAIHRLHQYNMYFFFVTSGRPLPLAWWTLKVHISRSLLANGSGGDEGLCWATEAPSSSLHVPIISLISETVFGHFKANSINSQSSNVSVASSSK